MPTLVAIGYPDATTAIAAAEEVRGSAPALGIAPEAIASVTRDRDGGYQVDTHHHAVAGGAAWGIFWGRLFDVLFFVPGGRAAGSGIDRGFQDEVRDVLQPGTSALFLLVGPGGPGEPVERLRRFGGTVSTSPLGEEQERHLPCAPPGGLPVPPAPVS